MLFLSKGTSLTPSLRKGLYFSSFYQSEIYCRTQRGHSVRSFLTLKSSTHKNETDPTRRKRRRRYDSEDISLSSRGRNVNNRQKGYNSNERTNSRNAGMGSPSIGGNKHPHLTEPSIVFSNNHLLLINKPPGYHSQPNASLSNKSIPKQTKCMLSKLKMMQLGGGGSNDFLLPMHRLDQPCTGILLLAKNSKAGTRVGNAFRKHLVQKDYFCVVNGNLENMMKRSERVHPEEGKGNKSLSTFQLSGVMSQKKGTNKAFQSGNSVIFSPLSNTSNADKNGRICHLEWQHLHTVSSNENLHLIRVTTGTGAKHQVRAMLSQLAKSPICGDLRYGARTPLLDKSVALHARSLCLPSVQLGDFDFKNNKFTAEMPNLWSQYFSLTEDIIKKYGY
mmetsp:Transcript_8623/g.10889  ORF Transcript_8623/g.10889 Transcript_8623/m.10889 type:complete len:390 (-) Transcript_8623:8-1177(-)